MSWQSIETAPKDRWILLKGGKTTEHDYCDEIRDDVFRPVVGKWNKDNEDAWDETTHWLICYWDGEWRDFYVKPTHWMEVPA